MKRITVSLLCVLLFSCTSTIPRRHHITDLCMFVEYLVRGDEESAYTIALGETSSKYRKIYTLFYPRYRSLDDKKGSYPLFIENRKTRYPTIRQFKRGGLIGEGLDGNLRYVEKEQPEGKTAAEKQLLTDLLARENLDREQVISFLRHNASGLGRKELILGFYNARKALALDGDPFEEETGRKQRRWTQIRKDPVLTAPRTGLKNKEDPVPGRQTESE